MDLTNRFGPCNRRKASCSLDLTRCSVLLVILCFLYISYAVEVSVLPKIECKNNSHCTDIPWISPYPKCYLNQCTCTKGCIHYTLNEKGRTRYFCGDCGTLGSQCSDKVPCKYPAEDCCRLDYCSCPVGYINEDICVHYQPVTTSRESIILIITFVVILIFYKIISSWKYLVKLFRRCFLWSWCRDICARDDDVSDEETAYGYNPESGSKTAAYTISSREFMSTTEDPDLDWALQLSSILASNLPSAEGSLNSNYMSRQPSHRRCNSCRIIRNRTASDIEVPHQRGSARRSSLSSSSSHSTNSTHCMLYTSTCTVDDESSNSPSPTASNAGTLQRTRSTLRARGRSRGNTNISRREYMNLIHIIRDPSRASTSSDELVVSAESLNSDACRRVKSEPLISTRSQNTDRHMPIDENRGLMKVTYFGIEETDSAADMSTQRCSESPFSSYSSAVSNFSRASGVSSTRPSRRNFGESFNDSLELHSQRNKTKLETIRKDVSIPLTDILRNALSENYVDHSEDEDTVNCENETTL